MIKCELCLIRIKMMAFNDDGFDNQSKMAEQDGGTTMKARDKTAKEDCC